MSLTAIQYRTLDEEFSSPKTEWIYDGEDANKWYACIRAADDYFQIHGKYPNPQSQEELSGLTKKVVESFAFDEETLSGFEIEDKYIEEM